MLAYGGGDDDDYYHLKTVTAAAAADDAQAQSYRCRPPAVASVCVRPSVRPCVYACACRYRRRRLRVSTAARASSTVKRPCRAPVRPRPDAHAVCRIRSTRYTVCHRVTVSLSFRTFSIVSCDILFYDFFFIFRIEKILIFFKIVGEFRSVFGFSGNSR